MIYITVTLADDSTSVRDYDDHLHHSGDRLFSGHVETVPAVGTRLDIHGFVPNFLVSKITHSIGPSNHIVHLEVKTL